MSFNKSWDILEYANSASISIIPTRLAIYEKFCKIALDIRKEVHNQVSGGNLLSQISALLENLRYKISDSITSPKNDLALIRTIIRNTQETSPHELIINGSSFLISELLAVVDNDMESLEYEVEQRNQKILQKILYRIELGQKVIIFVRKDSNAQDSKNYIYNANPILKKALDKGSFLIAPYRSRSESGINIRDTFDLQVLLGLPENYASPPLFRKLTQSEIIIQTGWLVASPLAPEVFIFAQSGQKGWKNKVLKSTGKIDVTPYKNTDTRILASMPTIEENIKMEAISADVYEEYSELWNNSKETHFDSTLASEELFDCYRILGSNGEKLLAYNIKKQSTIRTLTYNTLSKEFQIDIVNANNITEGDIIITSIEGADKLLISEEATKIWKQKKNPPVPTYNEAIEYVNRVHGEIKKELIVHKEELLNRIKNSRFTFTEKDQKYLENLLLSMSNGSVWGPSDSKQVFFHIVCQAVGEDNPRYDIIKFLRAVHQQAGQSLASKKLNEINSNEKNKKEIYEAFYVESQTGITGCWFGDKSQSISSNKSVLSNTAIFQVRGIMPQIYSLPKKEIGTIIE